VAFGERARRRENGVELVETVDDGAEGHQLAALLGHVAAKQRLDVGSDFEKPPIKQSGRLLGYRGDQLEAVLNGFHLIGCHAMPASLFPDQRTVACVRLRTIAANKPRAATHNVVTQRFAIQSSCQGE
jgi:hypothetical protein